MSSEAKDLREFGRFRLDAHRKVLWHGDQPVNIPLKEIELLCALTEQGGQVVTKSELLEKVWGESFVEESNLSRHIYLLRKTFKDFGEDEELIQTVPRRGYRFAGEVREIGNGELIIEKHSLTRTLIEEIENSKETDLEGVLPRLSRVKSNRVRSVTVAVVMVFAAAIGLYVYTQNSKPSVSGLPIKSIAVMPVKSFSDIAGNDKELRLRITDALITNLGSLQHLSVRPTSSILPFAEADEHPLEIGRKLEVDAVLEGRMQSEGSRLRITFQLIAVGDGAQIWSAQFDGETDRILSLQDTISRSFVAHLNRRDPSGQKSLLVKNPTENAEAYENFLHGRYFFNQRGIAYGESLSKARPYLERAIEIDPTFAAAIAGLADVVNLQTDNSSNTFKNLDEGYAKGRELALKALELDPNSAEAYAALGWIQQRYDWNYAAAEESFKKAIELKPNLTNAYLWLSILLISQGRADEALEYAKKAVEVEPTSPNALERLATTYALRGDCEKLSEILPRLTHYLTALYSRNTYQGELLSMCRRYSEAISLLEEVKADEEKKGNEPVRISATLGYCYAVTNQAEKARESLKLLEQYQTRGYAMYGRILIHANLGEIETALRILNESYQTRDVRLTRLKADPRLRVIHSEPRFRETMRKMNLADS